MRHVFRAALAAVLATSVAVAAPPEVPTTLAVPVGQIVRLQPLPEKGKALGTIVGFKEEDAFFDELKPGKDGQRRFMFQATKPGVYVVGWYTVGDTDGGALTTITVGQPVPPVPPVPPGPNPPVPPGPDPTPIKVESFRVLFVYEKTTATPLTAAQFGVIYGKKTADFLNARCSKTGAFPDWRIFDRDDQAVTETGAVKDLWAAVKPKVTSVPCLAVEVNGKVEIINVPASPEAAVATFKTYLGEK